MIEIVKANDVLKIPNKEIIPYVENLFSNIINSYSPSSSLEAVGTIYYLEKSEDVDLFEKMGFSFTINLDNFDTIESIDDNYINGCIVINNDFAINIIGKKEYFIKDVTKWKQ